MGDGYGESNSQHRATKILIVHQVDADYRAVIIHVQIAPTFSLFAFEIIESVRFENKHAMLYGILVDWSGPTIFGGLGSLCRYTII